MKSSAFTAVLVLVCAGLTFAFPFVVERITVGSWFPEVSAATETTPNAKIFHVYDTGVNTPILSVSPCVAYRVFQVELHTASRVSGSQSISVTSTVDGIIDKAFELSSMSSETDYFATPNEFNLYLDSTDTFTYNGPPSTGVNWSADIWYEAITRY